jgi:hypothetical protein
LEVRLGSAGDSKAKVKKIFKIPVAMRETVCARGLCILTGLEFLPLTDRREVEAASASLTAIAQ